MKVSLSGVKGCRSQKDVVFNEVCEDKIHLCYLKFLSTIYKDPSLFL